LSPIEGITQSEQESGIGYIGKMEQNIQNLKAGFSAVSKGDKVFAFCIKIYFEPCGTNGF
jgi:hypothetical protein